MTQDAIHEILQQHLPDDGLMDTGIQGVKIFRVTDPIQCAPVVYEPCVVAIVSGAKEAILDGQRFAYDKGRYLCCPMTMPVEAGTPHASPEAPLMGVYISLDTRVMTELTLEMESALGGFHHKAKPTGGAGLSLSDWDADFSEAMLRLVQLAGRPTDMALLGAGRLRELCYAILKGQAGTAARRAFGVGNEIARIIDRLSSDLDGAMSIEDMAAQVGMSRAVFHRKFKQATTLSPIQFVKSVRLNNAAMRIAKGTTVNEAAMDVGYTSPSQFSREFKRMYGQSPREWSNAQQVPLSLA